MPGHENLTGRLVFHNRICYYDESAKAYERREGKTLRVMRMGKIGWETQTI